MGGMESAQIFLNLVHVLMKEWQQIWGEAKEVTHNMRKYLPLASEKGDTKPFNDFTSNVQLTNDSVEFFF